MGRDALGPESPLQLMSPPQWKALGHRYRMLRGLGPAVELTWSLVLSSSSSLSSSRLRLMRSRRRFSTNGFSICDQRERKSGPTGPRLSAAARASDPATGKTPMRPFPQIPGCLGLVHSFPSHPLLLLSSLGSLSMARPLLPALSVFSFLLSSPLYDTRLFSLDLSLVSSPSLCITEEL